MQRRYSEECLQLRLVDKDEEEDEKRIEKLSIRRENELHDINCKVAADYRTMRAYHGTVCKSNRLLWVGIDAHIMEDFVTARKLSQQRGKTSSGPVAHASHVSYKDHKEKLDLIRFQKDSMSLPLDSPTLLWKSSNKLPPKPWACSWASCSLWQSSGYIFQSWLCELQNWYSLTKSNAGAPDAELICRNHWQLKRGRFLSKVGKFKYTQARSRLVSCD